uniref:Kelch-like ECH-associated protein 1 n=1 Tax=uncultured bacterium AOCefta2 TaxID=654977 RepID=D6MLX1_9BACT|nr:Kelch-like ECH-associated protein 1 [uncultured bacterium AOCefta2]
MLLWRVSVYRGFLYLAAFAAGCNLTEVAHAAQPVRFNYQAKLSNSSGALQGLHTIYVGLWDGGTSGSAGSGTLVYSETAAVTASNGVVNHAVGTGNSSGGPGPLTESIFASSNDIFLQIGVDSPANVVLPRSRLESVPFAINSRSSQNGILSGMVAFGNSATAPPGFTALGTTIYASWQRPQKSIPTARFDAGAAGNYVMGGFTDVLGTLRTNEYYNPVTDQWTTATDMPISRAGLRCVELNNLIYAIGGYSSVLNADMGANDVFDPAMNSWFPMQPLSIPRQDHVAAVVNGKIYVIGGITYGAEVDVTSTSVEEYNPNTNTWTPKAPMPHGRTNASAAVVNGKIYVMGGIEGSPRANYNEVYDPVANTWTSKAPMNVATYGHSAIGVGQRIYIMGGNPSTAVDYFPWPETRAYDTVSNTWQIGPPMISYHEQHAMMSIGGKVYVVGGLDESGTPGTIVEWWDPGVFNAYVKD